MAEQWQISARKAQNVIRFISRCDNSITILINNVINRPLFTTQNYIKCNATCSGLREFRLTAVCMRSSVSYRILRSGDW